jgi:hypothetical protein
VKIVKLISRLGLLVFFDALARFLYLVFFVKMARLQKIVFLSIVTFKRADKKAADLNHENRRL